MYVYNDKEKEVISLRLGGGAWRSKGMDMEKKKVPSISNDKMKWLYLPF